jgi:hypothetical protein
MGLRNLCHCPLPPPLPPTPPEQSGSSSRREEGKDSSSRREEGKEPLRSGSRFARGWGLLRWRGGLHKVRGGILFKKDLHLLFVANQALPQKEVEGAEDSKKNSVAS